MPPTHPWTRRARKRTFWAFALVLGIPLGAMVVVILGALMTGDWGIARWSGLAGLSGFSGFAPLIFLVPGRKKVIKHHGKICGNCLFLLDGLGDEGICPECGEPFILSETIANWESDFRLKLDQTQAPAN